MRYVHPVSVVAKSCTSANACKFSRELPSGREIMWELMYNIHSFYSRSLKYKRGQKRSGKCAEGVADLLGLMALSMLVYLKGNF